MTRDMFGIARQVLAGEDGGFVDRPATGGRLRVAHVRPAPGPATPLLVVPGGPGLASVLPYRRFRRAAAERGVDVVMAEHRGVGLSRRLDTGDEVSPTEVTVEAAADDLAAVLDARAVDRAVVYGSSYGTYLAQVFGARHPSRVAAMVLDSPMCSPAEDLAAVRAFRRARLWDGTDRPAGLVRAAVADGIPQHEVSHVVPTVYEAAGPTTLERLLAARLRGRAGRSWRWLAELGRGEVVGSGRPYVMEPDLVADLSFRRLGYAHAPDGLPLDPSEFFARLVPEAPPFAGDPVDVPRALPHFDWPVAVVSGERDLRTPRPIAERIAALAPDAVVVPLAATGHSALDTHPIAAITIARAVLAGRTRELPDLGGHLAALPRRGGQAALGPLLTAGVTLDALLP